MKLVVDVYYAAEGGGFVRGTFKSANGHTFEKTYQSDDIVELADIEKEIVTFSWKDGDEYIFMNSGLLLKSIYLYLSIYLSIYI